MLVDNANMGIMTEEEPMEGSCGDSAEPSGRSEEPLFLRAGLG